MRRRASSLDLEEPYGAALLYIASLRQACNNGVTNGQRSPIDLTVHDVADRFAKSLLLSSTQCPEARRESAQFIL